MQPLEIRAFLIDGGLVPGLQNAAPMKTLIQQNLWAVKLAVLATTAFLLAFVCNQVVALALATSPVDHVVADNSAPQQTSVASLNTR